MLFVIEDRGGPEVQEELHQNGAKYVCLGHKFALLAVISPSEYTCSSSSKFRNLREKHARNIYEGAGEVKGNRVAFDKYRGTNLVRQKGSCDDNWLTGFSGGLATFGLVCLLIFWRLRCL